MEKYADLKNAVRKGNYEIKYEKRTGTYTGFGAYTEKRTYTGFGAKLID